MRVKDGNERGDFTFEAPAASILTSPQPLRKNHVSSLDALGSWNSPLGFSHHRWPLSKDFVMSTKCTCVEPCSAFASLTAPAITVLSLSTSVFSSDLKSVLKYTMRLKGQSEGGLYAPQK